MAKMKDEALGKLKELGNSFLGNFGMSLDNFNMKQDEKTGSWNIRYLCACDFSILPAYSLEADLICCPSDCIYHVLNISYN